MSESGKRESPISGTAERLKAEKKYGDVLLYSWGLIEQEIYSILVQKFGYGRNKIDNMPFNSRVASLLEAKCFTEDDVLKIQHFKQKRDAVFHNYTNTMMWASGDEGKDELADIAIQALKASTAAFLRSITPIRDTGEIREYFLSFESVEPNAFRPKTSTGETSK